MLNEPAASRFDRPVTPGHSEDDAHIERQPRSLEERQLDFIRQQVEQILVIEYERTPSGSGELNPDENGDLMMANPQGRLIISFIGRLIDTDSAAAYEQLDTVFATQGLLPVFRMEDGRHVVHVLRGRIEPKPRAWWPNLLLFILTLGSVLIVGTTMALSEIAANDLAQAEIIAQNFWVNLWRGLPYAIGIMLILGAHELGHYFAARRHKLAVTLPYFLPFPFGFFGTFGAFIQLRQPMRNRRVLLDVGAAGPLAGLVFAIPILLIGLATSPVLPVPSEGLVEGNSVIYALAKFITKGEFLPSGGFDVFVNQLAWAGWTGLFVTGLNLIPLGQLDGGHVLYSLIGERARQFYFPLILAMGLLVIVSEGALLILLILLIFLGRAHAVPLDNITRLDRTRQRVAIGTLVIFLLVFVPMPLTAYSTEPALLPTNASAMFPALFAVGWVLSRRWLAR